MIHSVSNLELLLHCHTSPSPHPRIESEAIQSGIRFLVQHGMIEPYDRHYHTTEKGKFYIAHLMSIPFPTTTFAIPERK